MKIKLAISIFITLCMVLSACQPTPEEEAVVNKGGDWIETMIEKANGKIADSSVTGDEKIPFEYEAPEKQSYTLNGENITVKIDAQVYIPEYSLPMAILEDRNIKYSQIGVIF